MASSVYMIPAEYIEITYLDFALEANSKDLI